MIRAILKAQFLTLHRITGRAGAVLSAVTAVIWYGFWVAVASAAHGFTSDPEAPLSEALRIGFLLVVLYWQLAPVVSASLGASLDLRKLIVYPIPHRSLFFIEVLLRLTTGLEMLLVLVGGLLGLLHRPADAPRLTALLVTFTAFNLLLAAGLKGLLERLLMRKRIREVFVLLMVMAAALPQIVIAYRRRLGVLGEVWERLEGGWWPWSAAARWALGQDLLPAALALAGWTIAAFWFSRRLFERNLRFEPGPRLPVAGARAARHIHLPLRDPLAVMVEKELRALPRTPRFRLVFIMGFSFGLMVWLPILLRRGDSAWGKELLVLVSVYALMLLGQVTYWNAFGFDRSAALNYFWLPVSLRQVFAAKNLAALLFILLELTAIATVCLLLPLGVSPLKVLEAFLVTPVAALYLLAAGNLASVYFGRAMNPESASQAAGTARFQALVFFLYPVALLPVFLAYAARYAFASHVAFSAVLAFAALLGGVVYVIALDSTVAAAHRRRDILFAELCRSEGPVVTQ